MNQPELGKKIAALRNEKGLTQEELVAKCNISVRTIQRIESGEVIPRSYTVKSIFNALDFSYDAIFKPKKEPNFLQNFKNIFQIKRSHKNDAEYSESILTLSWVFGVIYFVVSSVEMFIEYQLDSSDDFLIQPVVYIFIKLTSALSLLIFLKGFIWLGIVFENYLLKIVGVMSMVFGITYMSYDLFCYYFADGDFVFGDIAFLFIYGFTGIIFGFAVMRLKKDLGKIAEITGILEIIAALSIVTIILAVFGLVFYIPVELFKIILLYKAIEVVKTKIAFAK